MEKALLGWNFDLNIAAGFGSINGRNDKLHMQLQIRPLLFATRIIAIFRRVRFC